MTTFISTTIIKTEPSCLSFSLSLSDTLDISDSSYCPSPPLSYESHLSTRCAHTPTVLLPPSNRISILLSDRKTMSETGTPASPTLKMGALFASHSCLKGGVVKNFSWTLPHIGARLHSRKIWHRGLIFRFPWKNRVWIIRLVYGFICVRIVSIDFWKQVSTEFQIPKSSLGKSLCSPWACWFPRPFGEGTLACSSGKIPMHSYYFSFLSVAVVWLSLTRIRDNFYTFRRVEPFLSTLLLHRIPH